ncbi:hypothetical protein B0H10DRAFT_1982782 [Mycena sp. CBHHK59/15]|nr:hypothetical protein B0H10DRAFT_1982782 [Mycena sp. CBHHK59/15]
MRSRPQPTPSRSAKASLDPALHSSIDAALKDLKTCARRLQPLLAALTDELQILHQLYYKGKNQHRPALFWRRTAEIRRYGDRVEELALSALVDSLRYLFFSDELQQSSKLFKGPWTHFPDNASVSFILERLGASLVLVQKMHERLARAYQSFALAMQSGAFIQLVLTLAAIASRMHNVVAEISEVLELTWAAVHQIHNVLDPTGSTGSRKHGRQRSLSVNSSDIGPVAVVHDDAGEDTGVSVVRRDLRLDIKPENLPQISLSPTPVLQTPVVERNMIVNMKHREVATNDAERPKVKKKRKKDRDEIDDIFG